MQRVMWEAAGRQVNKSGMEAYFKVESHDTEAKRTVLYEEQKHKQHKTISEFLKKRSIYLFLSASQFSDDISANSNNK